MELEKRYYYIGEEELCSPLPISALRVHFVIWERGKEGGGGSQSKVDFLEVTPYKESHIKSMERKKAAKGAATLNCHIRRRKKKKRRRQKKKKN